MIITIFCLYFLSYLIEITTLSVIISQFIDTQCFGHIPENIRKTSIPYHTKIVPPSATDFSSI